MPWKRLSENYLGFCVARVLVLSKLRFFRGSDTMSIIGSVSVNNSLGATCMYLGMRVPLKLVTSMSAFRFMDSQKLTVGLVDVGI